LAGNWWRGSREEGIEQVVSWLGCLEKRYRGVDKHFITFRSFKRKRGD